MASNSQSISVGRFAKLAASFRSENSGAWLRFLLAALGLTLAFGAAIFSTAARDAGNVLATVVLATLALLLAAGVGLGIVPYLARRVGARRLREALDFEVTRAGVLYAIVVLLIGVAALNTGNNLLYIIVAAMLAAKFSLKPSGPGSRNPFSNFGTPFGESVERPDSDTHFCGDSLPASPLFAKAA